MRFFSTIASVLALGGLGFASGALALAFFPPEDEPFVAPKRAPAVAPVVVVTREMPESWAPVFGTFQAAPPAPEPEPEPEVIAPAPPEENTTYWLTGLVSGQDGNGWAMITENDRGTVVRVGDTLIGGETVTSIDSRGVWIVYDGVKELIPVQKTNFGTMVQIAPIAENSAATVDASLADVNIPLEEASLHYLSELLSEAGRLQWQDSATASGFQVVSVSQGQVFDLMGLREGDMIVTVNGAAPQGLDLLANVPQFDGSGAAMELEILRGGARHKVRVTLEQI